MNILGTWNWRDESRSLAPSVRFGNLALVLGSNTTVLENESTALIFEGTIFDRGADELLTDESALDTAYGLYSYVKIKRNRGEIIVGTDRLGFSPLYYSRRGAALCFSTSLTLAKYRIGSVSPDLEAWDELLNIGDIVGDKTTVREIRRLPPGTRIHLGDQGISFATYWSPETPEETGRETYIRRNNELLAEALALTRAAAGPKIVLLSGGEDSRRIAVSAKAIDLPITCATQEGIDKGKADRDATIAERVSASLGVALHHEKYPPTTRHYNDTRIRDYWLGFETDQHEWVLPLLRNLPPKSLLYDGIAGDLAVNASIFRSHRYPTLLGLYQDKDLDQIARTLCGPGPKYSLDPSRLGSSLFERVREQLRAYPPSPRRVAYFILLNHARRNIGLQAQLYNLMGHKTCFPFLYYPLLMQSLSLDPRIQLELRYQRACMESVNPGIVRIPSTRDQLGPEFLIDLTDEDAKRERLAIQKARLRPEMTRLFPALRLRMAAFETAAALRIRPATSRLRWIGVPLARMSDCLDWLEDSDMPDLPVRVEEPSFLRKRLIRT